MRKILISISLVLFSALSFGQGAMMGSVGASGGGEADVIAPVFTSAEMGAFSDSILLVLMNEALDETSVPPTTAFNFTGSGTSIGVNAITINDDSLFVALDSALTVYADSTFLIDYTPGTPTLRDIAENDAVAWVDSTVTNNFPPSILSDVNTLGWYEASASNFTLTGTTSDSISQWDDLSDAGKDLTPPTPGILNRPVFDSDNSEVDFNAASSYLRNITLSSAQPFTIYLVIKESSYTAQDDFISNNSGDTFYFRQRSTSAYWGLYAPDLIQGNTGLPSAETYYILRLTVNGASSSLVMNASTTVFSGNPGTNDITVLTLGGADVSVKAVILRGVDDTAGNETIIVDYLNEKYSVY